MLLQDGAPGDVRAGVRYDSSGRRRPLKSRVSFTKRKRVAEVFEQPSELIHFLELDWLTGIAVCSLGKKTLVGASVSPAVLRNFYCACGRIREVLLAPRMSTTKFGASGAAVGEVLEHGIMFTTSEVVNVTATRGNGTGGVSGGTEPHGSGTGASLDRSKRTSSVSVSRKQTDGTSRRNTDPDVLQTSRGSLKVTAVSRTSSSSSGNSGGGGDSAGWKPLLQFKCTPCLS